MTRYFPSLFLNILPGLANVRLGVLFFNMFCRKNAKLHHLKIAAQYSYVLKKYDLYFEYLQEARTRFPNNYFGFVELSTYYYKQGDYGLALEALDNAPLNPGIKKRKQQIVNEDLTALEAEYARQTDQLFIKNKIEEYAMRYKKRLLLSPLDWVTHTALIRIYTLLKDFKFINKLLLSCPECFKSIEAFHIYLAESYVNKHDPENALRTLLAAQARFPDSHRLLLRIGALYQDSGQHSRAYCYYRAAAAINSKYGRARCLSFETDMFFLDEANLSLDAMQQLDPKVRHQYMGIINRISPLFPTREQTFRLWRNDFYQYIKNYQCKTDKELSTYIGHAIRCREVTLAKQLMDTYTNEAGRERNKNLWLETTLQRTTNISCYTDLATKNEKSEELFGIKKSSIYKINLSSINPDKTIEIFIPNVFFSRPESEKPTYETIRIFYKNLFKTLEEEYDDFVIIPRHQYNWRFCNNKIGARTISYHTFSDNPNPRRLHIQESTLSGRCSVDTQGFAGYSSLAHNFVPIDKALQDESMAKINEHYEDKILKYIENNSSKYVQNQEDFTLSGDYVFLAQQITTDIVSRLAWMDGLQLMNALINYYGNSDTRIVVKRHPYCNNYLMQRELKRLEQAGKIVISNASIHSLIKNAKIVFTVNSGVGFESLMHLKPVIVTGKCDYAYAVSGIAKNTDELFNILSSNISSDKDKILAFLFYYYNKFTIEPTQQAIHSRLQEWLSEDMN